MHYQLIKSRIFIRYPKEIEFAFSRNEKDNLAIFRSKAVGEPPLMYGIGAFFAIRNAIKEFNPTATPAFSAPITPEKVLLSLYGKSYKVSQAESFKALIKEHE